MTAREEPVVPVVLWRRVIRSNASWMDGTHRWVEHPRTGTDGMERFFAYPVALDPVPTLVADLAALRAERDEAVALLGDVRDHFAALGEDAEGPHPMVDRIDAIVARRKAT